jgi:hypothetical protein
VSFARDPVAVQFDVASARLLRRAHARPGQWAGTYLANPSAEWQAWGRAHGIALLGPDTVPGGRARTRWCRAFIRSAYWQFGRYYYASRGLDTGDERAVPGRSRALQFDVGTVRISPAGLVIGRAVRIRITEGGQAAQRAVGRLPDSRRIFAPDGEPAGRWADPADRDW